MSRSQAKNSLFLLRGVKEGSWGEWTLCYVYDTMVPPLNPPVLFLWQTSAALVVQISKFAVCINGLMEDFLPKPQNQKYFGKI